MGTSLPDTFASKIAAQNEKTADNAIGNVTGSNSVNVFLGLGLPWVLAAIYWQLKVKSYFIRIFHSLNFDCRVCHLQYKQVL
jgi:solute carrier family 8 (sodium/calcium exchanger)